VANSAFYLNRIMPGGSIAISFNSLDQYIVEILYKSQLLIVFVRVLDIPSTLLRKQVKLFCLLICTYLSFYPSSSQTYSSRYPNQGFNYVLLPSIFCVVKKATSCNTEHHCGFRYPLTNCKLYPGSNLPPVWEPPF